MCFWHGIGCGRIVMTRRDMPMGETRSEQERLLDQSLEETFPASDPISMQQILIVGRAQKPFQSAVFPRKADNEPDMTQLNKG